MKQEYSKPALEVLGELQDVTAATGGPNFVDVPQGTPLGQGFITS
ncbi:MAG: hypothetical protein ACRDS1_10650 [Pseudonocardiaceae bacterium]